MARDPAENNRAPTGTYFHVLSDVRRRHGILPTPRARRIPGRYGCRRRVFRADDGDFRKSGIRTVRNLKLRPSRLRISSQSGILAEQRLPGTWTERGLNNWYAALAECLRLSCLHRSAAFRKISPRIERKSDGRNEANRADRTRVANTRRNFRFGAERLWA